jgi:hypothetical protein
MRHLRQSAILRSLTWLALLVAVAASADLVEDTLFEADEAAAEGSVEGGAIDDVAMPSPRLAGQGLSVHPCSQLSVPVGAALEGVGSVQPAGSIGSVLIHGPPRAAPQRTVLLSAPLRI